MYCWILFARILLRIFAFMFITDIGLKFSFLCFLCLVLVSGSWWPHRMSWEMFLLKLFQKIAEEHLQIHYTLILKPKTTQKRKLQANITDEHRCKSHQQNFSKQNSAAHQKAQTPWSSWVYSRDARILQYTEINQCDTPY